MYECIAKYLVVQQKRDSSKTAVKRSYSNSTREFMERGPLRYEMDLYNLIKSIFNQRIAQFGIRTDTYDPK